MNIAGNKIESTRGRAGALTLALALGSLLAAGNAVAQLKPGPVAGNTVYLDKARGYAFCEFEVVMGKPPNLTVQVYNTSGTALVENTDYFIIADNTNGGYWINSTIPEPAEWAAIFGALALGLAIYRKRAKRA